MVTADLEARGLKVFQVSAATHSGLRQLSFAMAELVTQARGGGAGPGGRPHRAAADRGRRLRLHGWSPRATGTSSSAPSRTAGCGRPTSPTTRPSATSPTGWPGSASRRRWSRPAPRPATTVVIGEGERGVIFDWEPTHAGGRRAAARPARHRPAPRRTLSRDDHRRRHRPGRGQGRLVVADRRRTAAWTPARSTRSSTRWPRRTPPAARSCWCPRAPSRPGWLRWAWPGGPATWPPSRRPPASARACWCTATPTRSPGTASPSARCC